MDNKSDVGGGMGGGRGVGPVSHFSAPVLLLSRNSGKLGIANLTFPCGSLRQVLSGCLNALD